MNPKDILEAYKAGKLTKIDVQEKLRELEEQSFKMPLSEGQKGLWVIQEMSPALSVYNIPICFRGRITDITKFKEACRFVQTQYPILASIFGEDDGIPYQTVQSLPSFDFQQNDISTLTSDELIPYLRERKNNPFSLETGPLMRVHLLYRSEQEQIVLITIHHIVFDGSSMLLFITTLFEAYDDLVQGKKPTPVSFTSSYRDFVDWEQKMLTSGEGEKHYSFWKQQLSGTLPVLELPTDHPRSTVQSMEGQVYTTSFSPLLSQQVKSFAGSTQLTLAEVFLGVFNILLNRYSGQDDIIIGMPTIGRPQNRFDPLIGYFINMIPIRSLIIETQSIIEFIQELRLTVVGALDHAVYPFPTLVRKLKVPRIQGRTSVFQVAFAYQNYLQASGLKHYQNQSKKTFFTEFIEDIRQESEYDLELEVFEQETEFVLNMKYNPDLFNETTIVRMMEHYQNICKVMVNDPVVKIADIDMLSAAEKKQIFINFNNTKAEYPKKKTIHQLFEEQVERAPDNLALTFREERLTYRELNEKANQLARVLRNKGIQPDTIVAIMVERSLEMLVGVFGILKAGGAYLPIDPEYPGDRIKYLLQDSEAKLLLTFGRLADKAGREIETICLDDTRVYHGDPVNLEQPDSHHLAYVIYTSGSTGKPKGALIEHHSLVNRIHWMQKQYPIGVADVIIQKTPYTFDVSVWELFWWSMVGAKLCILEPKGEKYPEAIIQAIEKHKVTTMHFVPSMLNMFLEYLQSQTETIHIASLRWVFASGEALTVPQVKRFKEIFGKEAVQLINLYGPTEATIDVSYYNCMERDDENTIPIGKPIDNIGLYIMDRANRQLQPVGLPGELCIAGVGLARGYLNRPELTAEKFIYSDQLSVNNEPLSVNSEQFANNNFQTSTRLYKTGDLARWLPDGNIEYLGRLDHQVKIRGFRIELGEIEAVLLKQSEIKEAAVIVKTDLNGGKSLYAYIVANGKTNIPAIKENLKKELPEYMIPAYFIEIETMPLTHNGKTDRTALASLNGSTEAVGKHTAPQNNGKLDRKALPKSEMNVSSTKEYVMPKQDIEIKLAEIWKEILGLPQIGLHDNFFELGGDSIVSIRVVVKAKQQGIILRTQDLFEHQTIEALAKAAVLSQREYKANKVEAGEFPLTPIQKWFFEMNQPDIHHWNQTLFLQVNTPVNKELLEKAFEEVIKHHDALRLRFVKTKGRWIQEQLESVPGRLLKTFVLNGLSDKDKEEALVEKTEEVQASLSLEKGELIKAAFFERGGIQSPILMITIHHLSIDAVSWWIILEDLQNAYINFASGLAVKFPDKTTSYRHWAEKLQNMALEFAPELSYWKNIIRNEILPLPVDFSLKDGANTQDSAERVILSLEQAETERLSKSINDAFRSNIREALITSITKTLGDWTGHENVLIDIESHGRENIIENVDITRTVGWFTAIYPLFLKSKRNENIVDMIREVKETIRNVPQNGISYGILHYLNTKRDENPMASMPKRQVVFNYLGSVNSEKNQETYFSLINDTYGLSRSAAGYMPYLLEFVCKIENGILKIQLDYSNKIYKKETIQRLSHAILKNLREIIIHCERQNKTIYSPSDFPMANLTIEQLDRIVEDNPDIEDIYPVTFMQRNMIYNHTNCWRHGLYVWNTTLSIAKLDLPAFKKAWEIIYKRYANLRSTFVWEDLSEPIQIVHKSEVLPWQEYDISYLSSKLQLLMVLRYIESMRKSAVKPKHMPCMRLAFFKTGKGAYRMVWTVNYMLLDGWSSALIWKELFMLYEFLVKGSKIQLLDIVPYKNFISWLGQQDITNAENYYKEMFKTKTNMGLTQKIDINLQEQDGLIKKALVKLNGGRKRKTEGYYYLEKNFINLKENTAATLRAFSKQYRITLNTFIQGAWALVLAQMLESDDIVFGATVSGRAAAFEETEAMVGFFINTLPILTKIDGKKQLIEWLEELQKITTEVRQYEYAPIMKIKEWASVAENKPFPESYIVFENYPIDSSLYKVDATYGISESSGFVETEHPVRIEVYPYETVTIVMACRESYHKAGFTKNALNRLEKFLDIFAGDPEQKIDKILHITKEGTQ